MGRPPAGRWVPLRLCVFLFLYVCEWVCESVRQFVRVSERLSVCGHGRGSVYVFVSFLEWWVDMDVGVGVWVVVGARACVSTRLYVCACVHFCIGYELIHNLYTAGHCSLVVEHPLRKRKVAGSIPVDGS